MDHKANASSTVDKPYRVAGQPRCGVVVEVVVVLLMVEGVGWAGRHLHSRRATDFEPSPQIELGGSLTSGGSLTRRQRCNHNSNHNNSVRVMQARYQPKNLPYSKE